MLLVLTTTAVHQVVTTVALKGKEVTPILCSTMTAVRCKLVRAVLMTILVRGHWPAS